MNPVNLQLSFKYKNILININNAESEKYMHTSIQIKINIYFENHK